MLPTRQNVTFGDRPFIPCQTTVNNHNFRNIQFMSHIPPVPGWDCEITAIAIQWASVFIYSDGNCIY